MQFFLGRNTWTRRAPEVPAAAKAASKPASRGENIWLVVSLSLVLAFIASALWRVYLHGICCADDAYFAVIAKNLAAGLGYATTVPAGGLGFVFTPFDTYATTGAPVLLPMALLVLIFGNQYWVPGLAVVVSWVVPLLLIGSLAMSYTRGAGLALATLTFLSLSLATPWFYGAWYILLGEVPAALWLILGVFLYIHSETPVFRRLAGISFALAVLTKLLSLAGLAAFLFTLTISWTRNRPRGFKLRSDPWLIGMGHLGVGFAVPLGVFETWKLAALGPLTYLARLKELWDVLFSVGVSLDQSMTWFGLFQARLQAFEDSFGIWLPGVFMLFVLIWFLIKDSPQIARLFFPLVSMIVVFSVWWIFLSLGWPRYYIMPLVAVFAVLALPFLRRPLGAPLVLLYSAILVAWTVPLWPHMQYRFGELEGLPAGRRRTQALIEVAQLLDTAAAKDTVIVTQYWGTAADMEYMMDTSLNFTRYTDTSAYGDEPFLVALNTMWWIPGDPSFESLLENCSHRQKFDVYLIAQCELPPP